MRFEADGASGDDAVIGAAYPLVVRSSSELDHAADRRAAAASGLMALTGLPDGPPLYPVGTATRLDRLTAAVARWSGEVGSVVEVDWAALLTLRARLAGLSRNGAVSANGACRLLRGPDGWMALNLPRPDDLAAVEAMTGGQRGADPWDVVQRSLDGSSVDEMVTRARLLGVAAAPLGCPPSHEAPAWSGHECWPRAGTRALADLRIVDLSSMWAGPSAAALLSRAGGHVVKVESTSRPDGARAMPDFYRALHADDQPVLRVDFASAHDRTRLRGLLAEADVIIESSRPRALEQLGCGPSDVPAREGRVWVSITGYGRGAPGRDWVAFGDDAAVAGGLVAWAEDDQPVFCADAAADPIAGMVAAAAAMEAVATGGGVLVDVSMQACAASVAPTGRGPSPAASRDDSGWYVSVDGERVPVRDSAAAAQLVP